MQQGKAVIGDFQKAKLLLGHARDTNLLAQTYTRSSSSRFVAPELLGANAVPPNFKSDVWAFGMTVLQVFTGQEPYVLDRYKADYQVPSAVREGITPSRPKGNQWITDQVWQLLEGCWKMNPAERPDMKHVYDVLVAVDAALSGQSSDA